MIGEKIKQLREARGLTQTELAKLVGGGVKQQNIAQLEDGTVNQPRYLYRLIEALGTSYDDLITNKVYTQLKPASPNKQFKSVIVYDSPDELPENEFVMVNEIDVCAAAGGGYDNGDYPVIKDPVAFRTDWIRDSKARSTNLNIVTVSGDSMMPTLWDNDKILIDLEQNQIENGMVYAFIVEHEVKVKRLYKHGGLVIAHSDNESDPKYKYDEEYREDRPIKIIGRVVNRSGSGGL